MLKRFSLFILLFCSSSITSLAADTDFEYSGIKSGMTKTDLISFLDVNGIAQNKKATYPGLYRTKDLNEIVSELLEAGIFGQETKALNGKKVKLYFYFTDKELLWRLDVIVHKPSDPARALALERAVNARFKGYRIHEESASGQHGTNYYRVVMIDNAILNEAVERYTSEFMDKM
jgi:hypothetical protein